jgi:hypothetical protein
MEKPKRTRKKKDLNVNVDLGNADISLKRDVQGTEIDIDTRIIDVHIEKNEDSLTIDVEIDDTKVYEFVSNGESKHLPKGTLWKITGAMARHFIKKGFGKLK